MKTAKEYNAEWGGWDDNELDLVFDDTQIRRYYGFHVHVKDAEQAEEVIKKAGTVRYEKWLAMGRVNEMYFEYITKPAAANAKKRVVRLLKAAQTPAVYYGRHVRSIRRMKADGLAVGF